MTKWAAGFTATALMPNGWYHALRKDAVRQQLSWPVLTFQVTGNPEYQRIVKKRSIMCCVK